MEAAPRERHQLAMLNGDVAGYSSLMATDEDATIATLAAHRDAIAAVVVANHGRLVDFTGDNFLAEFGIATHALQCAADIQRAVYVKNLAIPENQRMLFRLGAHVGDVRIEGDRIYGNAVNIASRLEALSDAGGICLSQQMLDETAGFDTRGCEDLGERVLKNIPGRVRVWRVPGARLTGSGSSGREAGRARQDSVAPLPGIPTIAVLPFANLSSNRDQDDLVDAMTIDVITSLSCDRRFSVIASNSVMQFRGRVPDIADVGRTLGARYVVEGTVRYHGSRLRVTMALIDVETRRELWGDRLDREAEDVLEVFDEIVEAIVTALASHLRMAEGERFRRIPPGQLDAWALAIQASEIYFLNPTKTLDESIALAQRAVDLDPGYPYAWAVLGFLTAFKFPLGLSANHQADIDESLRLTERALALDARDPWNLLAKAVALQYGGRPGESMEYLQRSLRLNPSDVLAHCYYGRGLMFSGKPAIALAHFERFKRLNPNDPGAHMPTMYHAIALGFLQRWGESEAIARESLAAAGGRNPWSLVFLMVALGAQGRRREAAAVLSDLRRVSPHWDRHFVEGFLNDCQEDKDLLLPIVAILREVWPGQDSAGEPKSTVHD